MVIGALPPDSQLAMLLAERLPLAEIAVQVGLPIALVEEFRVSSAAGDDEVRSPRPSAGGGSRRQTLLNLVPLLGSAACVAAAVGFFAVQHSSAPARLYQAPAAGEVSVPSPCVVMWQGATPLYIPVAAPACSQIRK